MRRLAASMVSTVLLGLGLGGLSLLPAAPAGARGMCAADPSGSITRLYRAMFLRAPDAPGLAFWMRHCSDGDMSLVGVADGFAASGEFRQRYGQLGDRDFVTLLYRNVLHRDPDIPGLQASLAFLGRGGHRGEVVLGFSESAEFKAQLAGGGGSGATATTSPPTTMASMAPSMTMGPPATMAPPTMAPPPTMGSPMTTAAPMTMSM